MSVPALSRFRHPTSKTAITAVLLVCLLVAAGYVRFSRLEYSYIGGDQSILLGIAAKFVHQGEIPLAANKSSAGIMNPPLVEYLLAIPLFLRTGMLGAVRFTALLNLAAVAACYGFVAHLFGRRAGFLAALLFAANPWAVYYSRLIWNPTPIPLFSTLLLGSLLLYFAGSRWGGWLVLACVSLAAIVQLHLASLVLLLLIGLILVLLRRAVAIKPLLVGIGAFVLSFFPFLLFLRGTGFIDVRATLQALQGGEAVHFNLAPALLTRDLATGNGIFSAVMHSGSQWQAAVWSWFGLMRVESWLLVLSGLHAVVHLVRARHRFAGDQLPARAVAALILLLWLVFPTIMYARHGTYLQNYYFLYLYPAPFVLIALFLDDAWRALAQAADRGRTRGARLVLSGAALSLPAVAGLIAVWQFQLFFVRLDLTPQYRFDGRPVYEVDRLIQTARTLMDARPDCALVALAEGDSYETSSLGLLSPFLYPAQVRYLQTGRGLLVPRTCALYVVAGQDPWANTWLEANGSRLAQAGEEEPGWRFYELPASARQRLMAGLEAAPGLGEWANGIRLRSWQLEPHVHAGEALEVTYVWEVTAAPAHPRYHFFNHLLSQKDGSLVGQEDGPGVYSLYWRAGDLLITRFYIPVPTGAAPGDYVLNLGLYTWPEIERVPRVDGEDVLTVAIIRVD
jgi:hypothetical protein